MELLNILRILRRWYWVILLLVLLTAITLFLSLKTLDPQYEAKAKLQISTPQQEEVAIYDEYRAISSREMIVVARNNFVAILQSDEIKTRTLEVLNLDPEKTEFEVEVEVDNDSDYINVTVLAPSPSLAASITNTLVNEAVNYYGELRARPTIEEKELYARQLMNAEDEYQNASDSFTAFKAENKIAVLSEEIGTEQYLLEQLQAERDQRMLDIDVSSSISQLEQLIAQRQAELDRLLVIEPSYTILVDNYQEARDEYRQTLSPMFGIDKRQLAEEKYRTAEQALTDFRAQNKVTILESDVALQNRLLEQLQRDLDRRLSEVSNLEGLINQVDALILLHKDELDRLVALQPTYNVHEEKANKAKAKYQLVLTKYTEAELKVEVVRAANFIQVIEPAIEPDEPKNTVLMLFALGIVGSLGLGILMAFFLDFVFGSGEKETLSENLDSRTLLGLPVLGIIPILNTPLVRPNTPESESIRQLRANIFLSPSGTTIKTILIASPQTGDGKTIAAGNLGAVLADGKSKVVLVDADLRSPSLHELFHLPNLGGLADLLSSEESKVEELITGCLRSTDIPGLSLITAGALPQDPSLLLSLRTMRRIIEDLSKNFDYVIIDSPPTSVAPDSLLISKYTDSVLLILYPGKTSIQAAEDAVANFRSNEARLLGVTLNHASRENYAYRYYSQRASTSMVAERMESIFSLLRPPADADLLSMEEAASILGVRRKTVVQWRKDGRLKARRINLRWWVKREDLRNFVSGRFGIDIPHESFFPKTDCEPAVVDALQKSHPAMKPINRHR